MGSNLNFKSLCRFWLPILVLICAIGFLFWALCVPTDLATADLGRHIMNGKLLATNPEILRTNFYSYTYPGYQVLNHHWATGLVFYWTEKIAGFSGLRFLYIVLEISSLVVLAFLAHKNKLLPEFALGAILALPLMAERTEIRPEVFSYFFAAVYLAVLFLWRDGKIKTRNAFCLLIVAQLFWANLHIYFFLGPAIVSAFCLEAWLAKKSVQHLKQVLVFLGAVIGVSFLTPFGLDGVLEPFRIFQNYGYRIYENQSLGFLLNLFPSSILWYELGLIVALAGLIIGMEVGAVRNKKILWAELFLAIGFIGMAYLQLRNVALFGLVFPWFFAVAMSSFRKNRFYNPDYFFSIGSIGLISLLIGITLGGGVHIVFAKAQSFGLGLRSNDGAAADFIKKESLAGPIFNNYDVGGYLTYYLYPEKVFVDNRPEAYPADFFRQVYVPMQEKENVWQEELKKYNFNLIVFYYRDVTPWSQSFLAARLKDAAWAPVYVDDRILVLARRNQSNQKVIEQYEIPANRFVFNHF